MDKVRVFETFAGYGSQSMALQRLKEAFPGFDYEITGWSEFDPDSKYEIDRQPAVIAHKALHPEAADRNYGDIRNIDWNDVPDFDLFTMSSPCQNFSNAGLQEGGEEGSGTRSSLLWECRKAIGIKRPKYILFENVKALVGKKFLPLFQKWIRELEGFGYTNSYMVMNARNYGVPQNRERVIMISILGNEKFVFPNPFPLGRFLSDIMEDNADGKYYVSKEKVDSFVSGKEEEIYRKAGFEVKDEIVKLGHMWKSLTNGLVYMPNGVSPTLLVGGNCHNDIFLVEGYKEGRKVFPCSFRTRSYCGQPQQLEINFKGSWSNTVTTIPKDYLMAEIFDEIKVRRATPRECFRLMGVKESDIDTIMSCGISENFLYRLAGNSIVCGTGEKTCEELIDGSIVEHYDGILFNVLKKLLIDDKLKQKK